MPVINKLYTCLYLIGLLALWIPAERVLSAPLQIDLSSQTDSSSQAVSPAQTDPEETFAIVQRAISNGDVQLISRFTGTYTEVSILGATTMYSRAQTAYILKAFFREHPPERFAFQHKFRVGKDWYIRGKYANRGRQSPFKLEMTMRWNGEQFEISSISITND